MGIVRFLGNLLQDRNGDWDEIRTGGFIAIITACVLCAISLLQWHDRFNVQEFGFGIGGIQK